MASQTIVEAVADQVDILKIRMDKIKMAFDKLDSVVHTYDKRIK
jgi:hypothetical protein